MLRLIVRHAIRVLVHQLRHLPDPKAIIGSGSGYYRTKARVLKIEDGRAPLPYRCIYRVDDTIAFEGADGTLLQDGRVVEIVLEGRLLLRSATAAWGRLTHVEFDSNSSGQAGPLTTLGYTGATFRLQPA